MPTQKQLNEALRDALRFRDIPALKQSIKQGADVNHLLPPGNLPLGLAISASLRQAVPILLDAGAQYAVLNLPGPTSLFHEVAMMARVDNHDILDLFIERDTDDSLHTLKDALKRTPWDWMKPEVKAYYEQRQVRTITAPIANDSPIGLRRRKPHALQETELHTLSKKDVTASQMASAKA